MDLSFTSLNGELPDTYANLVNLQVMYLSDAGLSGPLPESWAEGMVRIRELHLANN